MTLSIMPSTFLNLTGNLTVRERRTRRARPTAAPSGSRDVLLDALSNFPRQAVITAELCASRRSLVPAFACGAAPPR